jgi:hypothetical protein
MSSRNRREFLGEVGKGMLVAGLGAGLADTLGVGAARADEGPDSLSFGSLEPLVGLMQDTPPDALLPMLVDRLKQGTQLRELVAAGALSNARTFGGEDYIGFHSFMALAPAYQMAKELPEAQRALPVLKVIYRSCAQIQAKGGRKSEILHPVEATSENATPQQLRDAMRARDIDTAERTFAGMVKSSPKASYEALQELVHDDLDVHRVVLAYRAWSMLDLAGQRHAHTLLRQSVRYCVNVEKGRTGRGYPAPEIRTFLPKVLERHRLLETGPGSRKVDDAWVDRLSLSILEATPEQAADIAAGALADGVDPVAVGEAITLAANQQVLRDGGRTEKQAQPGKPAGSVHGDSVGVHASDSVNAWRNIAAVSGDRNELISLVSAAAHVATGNKWLNARAPLPWAEHLEAVRVTDSRSLLAEIDAAIRASDQTRVSAVVQKYGDLGHASGPVFDLLLRYATSEDGSLHAEKYYRTVKEEFGRTRRAFRWRQIVALARVTASEYGRPAPGYAETCRLLKVNPTRTVRA